MQVVPVPTDDLLSKEYAKKRRTEVFKPDKVLSPICLHLLTQNPCMVQVSCCAEEADMQVSTIASAAKAC